MKMNDSRSSRMPTRRWLSRTTESLKKRVPDHRVKLQDQLRHKEIPHTQDKQNKTYNQLKKRH